MDHENTDAVPSSGWSRHRAPEPHPTRSGEVACLGCDEKFFSWDRTLNRLCPRCAARANRDTGIDR
jgi:hypothetical protein